MTVDQIALMYRMFLSAANGRAAERRDAEGKSPEELDYNLKDWEITYFLDKSGYRENFYHIHKDGLVHVSQMPQRGLPPARQVHVHQHVRVAVTGIDMERGRIALTMRGIDQPK
jgi:hypothetical protein